MTKEFFNLSNDDVFKLVCSNKEFLKMLVWDIYQIDLTEYQFVNQEMRKENNKLLCREHDILLTNGKEDIILRLQNQRRENLEVRSLVYPLKSISVQKKQGDKNDENILPVKILWLLNYNYGALELLKYQMLEQTIKEQFGDLLEIRIFNIKKYHQNKRLNKYKLLFNATNIAKLKGLKQNARFRAVAEEIIKYNTVDE